MVYSQGIKTVKRKVKHYRSKSSARVPGERDLAYGMWIWVYQCAAVVQVLLVLQLDWLCSPSFVEGVAWVYIQHLW